MDITEKCQQLAQLRTWVKTNWGIDSRDGNLWLPVVLTYRGPLYAEVIAQLEDGTYKQPYSLPDRLKQPLFNLGMQLITYLEATPAVYLIQFALEHNSIFFDRVIPYPGEPAIASKGVQEPDLYTCHWLCLERQPIFDLIIRQA